MDRFARQHDLLLPPETRGRNVDVVGAGALGGSIVVCLAKMGFGIENRITVTDFDRVQEHNLATQWFRPTHVLLQEPKVQALAEMTEWVADLSIRTVDDRFTGAEPRALGPIVVLAVDRLDERRRIWGRLRQRSDLQFLLDVRMGGEVLDLFAVDVTGPDVGYYEASLSLPEEEDAYEAPCGAQSIFYTVLGAAAFAGSILRSWVRGEPYPRHVMFDFHRFLIASEAHDRPARAAGRAARRR